MFILFTGGADFIGSHTCVALLEEEHSAVIADNLYNSKAETINKIEEITDKKLYSKKLMLPMQMRWIAYLLIIILMVYQNCGNWG